MLKNDMLNNSPFALLCRYLVTVKMAIVTVLVLWHLYSGASYLQLFAQFVTASGFQPDVVCLVDG